MDLKDTLFSDYFKGVSGNQTSITADENTIIGSIQNRLVNEFSSRKYFLGLVIDFCLLAQVATSTQASVSDFSKNGGSTFFQKNPPMTHRANKELNTLTLILNGNQVGIRKFEELVKQFFESNGYYNYPSAYVYNTGQWKKFTDVLDDCFNLSSLGRRILVQICIDFGFQELQKLTTKGLPPPKVHPLDLLLTDYSFSAKGENGGLFFQSLVFALCKEVFYSDNIVASGVRTGSSRQQRFGDIDVFEGSVLAASVEVKDMTLSSENCEKEIGQFALAAKDRPCLMVVVCKDFDKTLTEYFPEITFLDYDSMKNHSCLWHQGRWIRFFNNVKFYLSRIEMNEAAVERFDSFIDRRWEQVFD